MKKVYKRLPMIIFIIFIATMFILFLVLPKKEYSSSEKRYLAKAPEFNEQKLFEGEFRDSFESYIEDHTAGRDYWVGLAAYYNIALNNNGSKGVYQGKDGYLINDPTDMEYFSRNIGICHGMRNRKGGFWSRINGYWKVDRIRLRKFLFLCHSLSPDT